MCPRFKATRAKCPRIEKHLEVDDELSSTLKLAVLLEVLRANSIELAGVMESSLVRDRSIKLRLTRSTLDSWSIFVLTHLAC